MAEHPVITLLVKRMESHPDEFVGKGSSRWETILNDARMHATEEDAKTLQGALSRACMDRLYDITMDELLNGEERRAEEERTKHEKSKAQATAVAVTKAAKALQQAALQQSPYSYAQLNQQNLYNQAQLDANQFLAQQNMLTGIANAGTLTPVPSMTPDEVREYIKDYVDDDAMKSRKRGLLRGLLDRG